MLKYKIAKEGVFPLNKEIIGINNQGAKLNMYVNLKSRLKEKAAAIPA